MKTGSAASLVIRKGTDIFQRIDISQVKFEQEIHFISAGSAPEIRFPEGAISVKSIRSDRLDLRFALYPPGVVFLRSASWPAYEGIKKVIFFINKMRNVRGNQTAQP